VDTDLWQDIQDERDRQDAQWGGPKHDDQHTASQWASFRGKFENRQLRLTDDPRKQREELVKIAALTIAQIESLDRNLDVKEGA
jgi:hypothetical protein